MLGDKMSQTSNLVPLNNSGNVKVVCRFRPLNERQKAVSQTQICQILDERTVRIQDKDAKQLKQALRFSYDKVFDTNSTQLQLYNYAAASVIDSVMQGFNGTIFAYGQTASGKTYTMQGDLNKSISEQSGIVPRMVQHIFDAISKCDQTLQFRIKVSVVQLYMQKLRDLLDSSKVDLKIRSDKTRGVFIQSLTQRYISTPQQVYDLLTLARSTRVIASTNMNEASSRSHVIFLLTIRQNSIDGQNAKSGKLYLVDLAGSQKISKTGAQGKLLDQAKKINMSLTTLGKVINALTDGKSTHIPYRDSKLTRVLQQSLGGNSKTTLIITCSPHTVNMAQTVSTLRFGLSAKKIKNKPQINKELTVAELQQKLAKMQKKTAQRDNYIKLLRDYIVNDLKQKMPQIGGQNNSFQAQNTDQNQIIKQLQRQLDMQRNLHVVQQQQYTAMKLKCQQAVLEKQQLQRQLKQIKAIRSSQFNKMKQKNNQVQTQQRGTVKQLLIQLQKLTDDQRILQLVQSRGQLTYDSGQHARLLAQYQAEKQMRKKAQENLSKYDKNMQKKLVQLENNICQLTHSYYDLVVVQQRYKVDNAFLKKNLEVKDVTILSLKKKIKDLEDQNRDLEDQKWGEEDLGSYALDGIGNLGLSNMGKISLRKSDIDESSKQFQQAIERRNIRNAKVVKVLTGGRHVQTH